MSFVPCAVRLQLREPEIEPGFRQACQFAIRIWVTVPEAAMDKYSHFSRGEHHIWCSWQVTPMEAVAIAHAVHQASNHQLGLGVPSTHARHALAAFRWCEGIGHTGILAHGTASARMLAKDRIRVFHPPADGDPRRIDLARAQGLDGLGIRRGPRASWLHRSNGRCRRICRSTGPN